MALYTSIISSLIILTVTFITISSSIPFIVLHGIGNACSHEDTKQLINQLTIYSGSKGYCVEIGNGTWTSWFMPLQKQVEIACDKVKNMNELRKGYNIVGLSQGNLIGRGVVELCDGGPPVNNFISLAGPHAGIASLPLCGPGVLCDQVSMLIKSGVYSNYVQAHLAPSGYLKVPTLGRSKIADENIPGYLKNCNFLPMLNNELQHQRNSTRKKRFSRMQNLVLIMFENDNVLVPKETSWFGFYPDGAFSPVLRPQKTKLYIEDWIGLKTLDRAGRVHYIRVPGTHIKISKNDTMKYVVPYI